MAASGSETVDLVSSSKGFPGLRIAETKVPKCNLRTRKAFRVELLEIQGKGRGETTKLGRGTFAFGLIIGVFFPWHTSLSFFPHQHVTLPEDSSFIVSRRESVGRGLQNPRGRGRGHVKPTHTWSEQQGSSRKLLPRCACGSASANIQHRSSCVYAASGSLINLVI